MLVPLSYRTVYGENTGASLLLLEDLGKRSSERLLPVLREAGCRNIAASASSDAFGTPEMTDGFSLPERLLIVNPEQSRFRSILP